MNKLNISIISILLIIMSGAFYWQAKTQDKLEYIERNYKASNDSLNIIKLKNNELIYEKYAYMLNESELNEYIDIKENEIKELKRNLKSNIDYISKIEGFIKIDTIHMNDTIYVNNDTTVINFKYSDQWLNLNGITKITNNTSNTIIDKLNIPLSIKTGLTEDYNIFIKTDNPYIDITNIEGAVLNKRKNTINIKRELLFGMGIQYGLFNKNIDFGPQISYGFIIEF